MTAPGTLVRADGRPFDALRPVSIETGYLAFADGERADLARAHARDLRGDGRGPRPAVDARPRQRLGHGRVRDAAAATPERNQRESAKGRLGGRTHEIQRLIGRALRSVVDMEKLGERRSWSTAT
jgi:ribonuclease PH